MWERIEKALLDWEATLVKNLAHEGEKYRAEDLKWVHDEIPRVEEELQLVSLRVHKLEELIAKARMLLFELENDECKLLTDGADLHQVGKFLKEKFGDQLAKNYSQGRKEICAALQEKYNLGPKAARELFSLLKEAKIIRYTLRHEPGMEVPPTPYPAEEAVLVYNEVLKDPVKTEPPLKPVWEIG
ncbi:hypothetical protein J7J55_00135 [Candidatus Bipolaricaulota bacterium]|nr:hypothetical protein [Candidatus Bipolaricaulota bacterium]